MLVGFWVSRRAASEGDEAPATVESVVEVALVPIPNAKLVGGPTLLGGQPTQANLREAAEAGYRTVINLRPEGEFTDWDESAEVASLGMRYVSIPMPGAEGLSEENAARLRAELERAETGPAMVHCSSGNRVGALYALSAFHSDGEDPARAIEIGLEHGLTSLEPQVAEYLANAR